MEYGLSSISLLYRSNFIGYLRKDISISYMGSSTTDHMFNRGGDLIKERDRSIQETYILFTRSLLGTTRKALLSQDQNLATTPL